MLCATLSLIVEQGVEQSNTPKQQSSRSLTLDQVSESVAAAACRYAGVRACQLARLF